MTVARRLPRLGIALVAVVMLASACLSANQVTVRNLTNTDRTANGQPALADYSAADAKAQAWAEHLAATNPPTLSHDTWGTGYPAGTWYKVGENVGMAGTLDVSKALPSIEQAFMASPGHRANILDPAYDHLGTGVATNPTTGYTFVVQEFVDAC